MLTWHHKCSFSCDRKDVLYVLICNNCNFYYIGQIEKLKQRTWKHKSDVINPITVTVKNIQSIEELAQEWSNHISVFTHFYMKKINTFKNLKKDAI